MAEIANLKEGLTDKELLAEIDAIDRRIEKEIERLNIKEEKNDAWRSLISVYWQLCEWIIKKQLKSFGIFDSQNLTPLERSILDFGFLDSRISGDLVNKLGTLLERYKKVVRINKFVFYPVSEYLKEIFLRKVGWYALQEEKKKLDELKAQYSKVVETIKVLAGKLQQQLHYNFFEFMKKVDRKSFLRFKLNSGQVLPPEEKQELLSLEEELNATSETIKMAARKVSEGLASMVTQWFGLFDTQNKLASELEKQQGKVTAMQNDFDNMRLAVKEDRVLEAYRLLRQYIKHTPLLSMWGEEIEPFKVVSYFENLIFLNDRRFSENSRVKNKIIEIVVVPGCNRYGTFIFEESFFMFPLVAERNVLEVIASSVADFHWYTDDMYELRGSFQTISKELMRMSTAGLKKEWFNSYILWIVKESQGYKVMDKNYRKWFKGFLRPISKKKLEEMLRGKEEKEQKKEIEVKDDREEQSRKELEAKQEQLKSIVATVNNTFSQVVEKLASQNKFFKEKLKVSARINVDKVVFDLSISDCSASELETIMSELIKVISVVKKIV